MDSVSMLRQCYQGAHQWLEATMQGVTSDQAHWAPPGKANPLGATYAHVVLGEDMMIKGLLQGAGPLFATTWAGKLGLSEPPPPPEEQAWDKWGRQVKIDLPAVQQYAQAVYKASDEYLASLNGDALARPLDLSGFGLGQQTVGFFLGNILLSHVNNHCGEVSCLKGLQGAKGYPV